MSTSGAERQAVIDRECLGNDALRQLVGRMLEADDQLQPVLDQPGGLAQASEECGKLNAGDRIGEYRIIREIGSGGMGTVYQAQAGSGEDFVAIKVVRWNSPGIVRRFQQEQSILSGLRHPNITGLLATGFTAQHHPYFVMEYVEGDAVDVYCQLNACAITARLRLFRQVCAAVIYLHQNLIIHRDLKPANILVTAAGAVKLVDFGIAKLLQTSSSGAHTIAGLMTPDYASPEQIQGKPTSTRTDVYALGVLLYELLAGRKPFEAGPDRVHETLRRICEDEPVRPSLAGSRRELRGELDTIVLKALRKAPDERYVSVEQFDEDLRRYLRREPVLAQGDSLRYRASKFLSRHRGAATASLVMLALTAAGVVGTGVEARIARQERQRADAHARAADSARIQAEAERGRANAERLRAENQAAEAGRERSNAERRLRELQRLTLGLVATYRSSEAAAADSSVQMAGTVRDALLILGQERRLDAGQRDILAHTEESLGIAPARDWQVPEGWEAWQTQKGEYSVRPDRLLPHGGNASLLLRSVVPNPQGLVYVGQRFSAASYSGRRVRLTGFLRTQNVSSADLLLFSGVGFIARRFVTGTTQWTRYELVTDVPANAESVHFGIELAGTGKLWADDLSFEVVDRSIPISTRDATNLDFTK